MDESKDMNPAEGGENKEATPEAAPATEGENTEATPEAAPAEEKTEDSGV